MISFLWMLETVLVRFWNLETARHSDPHNWAEGILCTCGGCRVGCLQFTNVGNLWCSDGSFHTNLIFCDVMSCWRCLIGNFSSYNLLTCKHKPPKGGVGTLTRILDFVHIEVIWDHGYYIMMTHGVVKCDLLWSDQGHFWISRQVAASISPSSMRKPRNFTLC